MRRPLASATITCLVIALTASAVLALASGPPTNDSFVRITEPASNFDNLDLSVAASTESCTATETTYIQWDLSDIPGSETVDTATLTLTAKSASNAGSAMLSLYETQDTFQSTTTPWTEDGLTADNAPAVGVLIETQAAPTAAGQTVTFNSTALATYVNGQAAGDDVVSFVLQFSSGCAAGATFVAFEDRESGANGPDLQLKNPTAVRLQSFHATSPGSKQSIAFELTFSVLGLTLIGGLVGQRARLFGLVACLPRQGECATRPSPGELRRA